MKYGNLDLQTEFIITSAVTYRQMGNRILNTTPISRRPGDKFLSEDFGSKTIVMEGYVVSTSTSGLIGLVDSMHKELAKPEQSLIIDDGRQYVATCSKAEFPELSFNRSVTPFSLEFLSTAPFAYGDNLNATFVMPSGTLTQTITTTISGSAFAEPQLTLTTASGVGNAGFTKIVISHDTTGTNVTLSGIWSKGLLSTTYNYDNATVTYSGLLKDYTGTFDRWQAGDNSLTITFTGKNDFGVQGLLEYIPRYYF